MAFPATSSVVQRGDSRAAWWPLALLCAAQFGLVLNFQVVTIVLPSIDRGLGLSASGLQWVVSANALAYGGLLLLAGRLADLYGARRIFLSGLLLFAAASFACGIAVAPAQLIAARGLQGAGAGLTSAGSLALLTATYQEGPERSRALGFWGASGPLGGVAGILLGGGMASSLGWRAIFLLLVPISLTPVLLAPFRLPSGAARRSPRRAELDLPGAMIGTAACVALVFGLTAMSAGFGQLVTGASIGGAILLALLFWWVERRAEHPLFPFAALRRPPLAGATLITLLFAATTNTPIFFFVLVSQEIEGHSAFTTGLLFLPCNLAVITGAMLGSRLADRVGGRLTSAAGMGLVAVGTLVMARLPATDGYLTAFLPGFIVEGVGLGMAQVATVAVGTSRVAERTRGFASGLLNSSAQIGTALGLALLVSIATIGNGAEVTEPSNASLPGFRYALLATSCAAGFAALLSLRVLRLPTDAVKAA